MNEKSLRTLEYDKILEQLVKRASCCISRELAMRLEPLTEYHDVCNALALTSEAETLFIRSGYSPVDDFPDMREVLKRIHAVLFLSQKELLNVASCLRSARNARQSILSGEKTDELSHISNLARTLITHEYIEEEINRCVMSEDELFDTASPALARIRRQMKLANEKVREKLNTYIRSNTYSKYLQEPIITMRNGRFVIPVKQEYRTSIPGLVHDQSGSGQTIFVEPTAVVELGNEYKRLLAEEAEEVERILTELTAAIVPHSSEIYDNMQIMGEIDICFAKAKLAREQRAVCPKLNDNGYVSIIAGRHPLLNPDTVVPIDIWICDETHDKTFSTLIITGPNTGGKTVTLKTVGLLTLMAMSGLFVPANVGTELSVFEAVLADIGDEQSIEQSLSTFSSHMRNIVSIFESVGSTRRALVLLDELGAGTDPVEGAALAMSILSSLHEQKAITVATTHYSEVKTFALSTEGMENACMEFNVDELRPTYRLFIGIPGKSNAFLISKRLGLTDSVIERAKTFLTERDVQLEDIISDADATRRLAEREKELATLARAELDALRAEVEAERIKLEESREKNKLKAKEDARRIVADAKREAEQIIKSLKELKLTEQSGIARGTQEARDRLREMDSSLAPELKTPSDENKGTGKALSSVTVGQAVFVTTVELEGEVLSLPNRLGEVQVRVGAMKMAVKLSELRSAQPKVNTPKRAFAPKSASVPLQMDIRGMLVEEAIPVVDDYVERAYLAGISEINVIHGKGTGALRSGIQEFLRSHKRVAAFRMGKYGEGDAGVTVVEIKK